MKTSFSSKEVEAIGCLCPATLRNFAQQLPLTPWGKQGKKRDWHICDVMTVLLMQKFMMQQYKVPVAAKMAGECRALVSDVLKDEHANRWLVVSHGEHGSLRIQRAVSREEVRAASADLLSVAEFLTIINIRQAVTEMSNQIACMDYH